MYIDIQTIVFAFKIGTYVHTANTVWTIYKKCKNTGVYIYNLSKKMNVFNNKDIKLIK